MEYLFEEGLRCDYLSVMEARDCLMEFGRPHAEQSRMFDEKRLRSIHGIHELINGKLAIAPKRMRKILHYMLCSYSAMEQRDDLTLPQIVLKTIEHTPVVYQPKQYQYLIWYNFLSTVVSFRGGNYSSIDIAPGQTNNFTKIVTSTDVDIKMSFAFVRMIYVDYLIEKTFDIRRESPLEDWVLSLLHINMHESTKRDTFDKLSNFLLVFYPNYSRVLLEAILSQQDCPFEAAFELFKRLKIDQTGTEENDNKNNENDSKQIDDETQLAVYEENMKLFAGIFASFIPQIDDNRVSAKNSLHKLMNDHQVWSTDERILRAIFENDYLSMLKEFLPFITKFLKSPKANGDLLKNWYEKYWTKYGIRETATTIHEYKINYWSFRELLRENPSKIRKLQFDDWLEIICDVLIGPSAKQFLCRHPPLDFSSIMEYSGKNNNSNNQYQYLNLLKSVLVGSDPYLNAPSKPHLFEEPIYDNNKTQRPLMFAKFDKKSVVCNELIKNLLYNQIPSNLLNSIKFSSANTYFTDTEIVQFLISNGGKQMIEFIYDVCKIV